MLKLTPYLLMVVLAGTVSADYGRQKVDMPDPMRDHMLSNMRDHLVALEEITRYLSQDEYDLAAEVAEKRLGISSLESHGAAHMAQFMPKGMGEIGTRMHRSASRFAIAAQNASVEGGLAKAFAALSDVMQQCVACHSGYKVH